MKFDTQDFGNISPSSDLTGFTHAIIDWIAYMDTKQGKQGISGNLSGLINDFPRAYAY